MIFICGNNRKRRQWYPIFSINFVGRPPTSVPRRPPPPSSRCACCGSFRASTATSGTTRSSCSGGPSAPRSTGPDTDGRTSAQGRSSDRLEAEVHGRKHSAQGLTWRLPAPLRGPRFQAMVCSRQDFFRRSVGSRLARTSIERDTMSVDHENEPIRGTLSPRGAVAPSNLRRRCGSRREAPAPPDLGCRSRGRGAGDHLQCRTASRRSVAGSSAIVGQRPREDKYWRGPSHGTSDLFSEGGRRDALSQPGGAGSRQRAALVHAD